MVWGFSTRDYLSWIERYDVLSDQDRRAIADHLANLRNVSFSVLTIAEGCSADDLTGFISSLERQLFPHWELLIATGFNQRLDDVVRELAGRGHRIRTISAEGSRAHTANAMLQRSTGDFIAWFPAGDRLSEQALYRVAVEANKRRPVAVYSDHDALIAGVRRSTPQFKPAWDPELILGLDYVGPSVFFERSAALGLGGFRDEAVRAEVYDLLLRATDDSVAEVIHIPAVLYHAVGEAVGQRAEAKANSELRAVEDALARRAVVGAVVERLPKMAAGRRVVWPVSQPEPLVSIIIPTRDRGALVENAVSGILTRTRYQQVEVIIADNDSVLHETKEIFDRLQQDKRVRIVHIPGEFNFSGINNTAVREARGEFIVLMNNDVEVIDAGWLDEMVGQLSRPTIGAVGVRLLYEDGRIQHAGVTTGPAVQTFHPWRLSDRDDPGYLGALSVARSYIAVTGACLGLRRDLYDRVGGLNEIDLKVAFNDVDLCLKIGRLGYRILWTPFAELYHLESVSRGLDDTPEKLAVAQREQAHMHDTWLEVMDTDPYHNPNTQFTWTEMLKLAEPRYALPWRSNPVAEEVPQEPRRRLCNVTQERSLWHFCQPQRWIRCLTSSPRRDRS